MKRWVTMTASLLIIAGIGCAGELVYLSGQKRDHDIENKQAALALQISDLNDRLVASTRNAPPSVAHDDATAMMGATLSMAQVFPRHWLRENLQLAQSQLEQDQTQLAPQTSPFHAAKDTLNLVKSNLNTLVTSQAISALTASALSRAIDADLKMIDDEAQAQHQEIQLLDRNLAQLQMTLDQMARQGPSMHSTANANSQDSTQSTLGQSFMQRIRQLIIVEKPALDVRANMLQRGLICHEAALTLGLARQALAQGQWDQVVQLLADSRAQLAGLVDADAKQMQVTLANLAVKPHPKLQLTVLQWLPADTAIPFKSTDETGTTSAALSDVSRVAAS